MNHLAELAPLASAAAVVVAIVFGTLTLRQWQRTRYLQACVELVRTIQSPQFNQAIGQLLDLPVAAPPERVLAKPELVAAAYVVSHTFESLGVLVFHRVLSLQLVDQLTGGYVRAVWQRLQPYVGHWRGELGVTFCEWFQWLDEQLQRHPAAGKQQGAHVAFRDWRP